MDHHDPLAVVTIAEVLEYGAMQEEEHSEFGKQRLLDLQTALYKLRDGLLDLSMSLQELSFITDDEARTHAGREANSLFSRLRG